MRKLSLIVLFLYATGILGSASFAAERTELTVDAGWKFREVGKTDWRSATVPGSVHTDLLDHKLIPDPFYRNNEKKLQWIGKTNWEYETTIAISRDMLARDSVELFFEGLDTYATVFLNDKQILEADNMFRQWRVDIKDYATVGDNKLKIVFRSPINEILPRMSKLDYQLPASNDQGEKTSPYTRKAPYQYGWDWGPRFVTSGIWKPVRLITWDKARIESLDIKQVRLGKPRAELSGAVEIVAVKPISAKISLRNITDKTRVAEKAVQLAAGENEVFLDFEIVNPRLWYPVQLGEQPLYEFELELEIDGRIADSKKERTGLRTVELRQKPDQWGSSFEFVINGIPVFGKGGNWIPADSFPTRVTKQKYRHLMESMRDANMNMVRVWGGGIYEDDYFYELADEMGILVWQDFMFACSMYPGDSAFLENVRREAIDNIKRLRNHPSIVLWCGNNEVETAWNHWGWKQRLPSHIWDDYLKLFARLLPEVVEKYDPETPYWSSSPSSNFQDDADSQKVGDVHYWGVWHASLPFEEYQKQFPRFMSEYGFQSFPEMKTVESYTEPADRKNIETEVMLAHQKHPRGNQLIREYMLREYNEPKDFESFLYVSQVLQAEGMRIGTEHFRRIMPRNMGALYWQVNDCWPVASWAGTDYFGRWKAMHYFARRFFEPLMVSPLEEDGNLNFYVVSDFPDVKGLVLQVKALDLDGNKLYLRHFQISAEPLKGKSYVSLPVEMLLDGKGRTEVVVEAQLSDERRTLSTNHFFFAPFKELKAQRPRIDSEVTRTSDGLKIRLTTDKVAKAVYLDGPAEEGFFSDNFFTLLPGSAKEVVFRTGSRVTVQELKAQLRVRSLADAF
ncbi:MAG: glycoside hydrolase family 2 protein [Acidobacteriota bacterium]|nr:glycoside hydrolase family 2 protein [Acidobacteriota bacterium]MDH3528320.1 glycoside hydrolase family 2 protein [Acidobacteriota bacterium]